MGRTKGAYVAEFGVGTIVHIADRLTLEKFMQEWKLHHPLQPEQLQYADRMATVKEVGFYHGGDELYQFEEVPGIWHEENVRATSLTPSVLGGLLSLTEGSGRLKAAIQYSIIDFRRGLAETGRTAPLEILEEGRAVSINQAQVENLCHWYMRGQIDVVELEYVASLLDLSEDFQYDDKVRDAIFALSTPEKRGDLSPESVTNIIKRLTSAA